MDRDQQDKILAFHERSESVPKECQSECHMILPIRVPHDT